MAKRRKSKSRKTTVSATEKRIKRLEAELRQARKQLRQTRKPKKKKKKVRKKRVKKLPLRGRDETQKPKLALARDYDSGFKPFLERVDKRRSGTKMRSYAIVRVVLLDYAGTPTRDLAIFLGSRTRKQLLAFTNAEILERAPGRWGTLGKGSEVLFIAGLKGKAAASTKAKPDKVRQRIAKRNPKARAALKAANIRREQQGLGFNP